MRPPELVGRLADLFGGKLQKAILILPVGSIVDSALWLALVAVKTKGGSGPSAVSA